MTAEVAVINKSAVALAADSAVTIQVTDRSGKTTDKVYNTANKLFTLSKHRPVGIMVYNVMELGGVPWETIVKEFRKFLGKKSYPHLENYCSEFFIFLENNNGLFPEEREKDVLLIILLRYFSSLLEKINSNVQAKDVFDGEIENLEKEEYADDFDDSLANDIYQDYKTLIDAAAEAIFKPSHIRNCKSRFRKLAKLVLTKKRMLKGYSGVVIAGFGEDDAYPSIHEYQIDHVVKGRIRKIKIGSFTPGQFHSSKVLPFAQDRMVLTMIEGINPDYAVQILKGAFTVFKGFPKEIIDQIKELTAAQKQGYIKALTPSVKSVMDGFFKRMDNIRKQEHTSPIEQAIAVMPFSELAAVAEIFVNVEQIKQRLSLEAETVGGPIDVAVVSKGDGFIWIKRKHYFDAELNKAFVSKYFET